MKAAMGERDPIPEQLKLFGGRACFFIARDFASSVPLSGERWTSAVRESAEMRKKAVDREAAANDGEYHPAEHRGANIAQGELRSTGSHDSGYRPRMKANDVIMTYGNDRERRRWQLEQWYDRDHRRSLAKRDDQSRFLCREAIARLCRFGIQIERQVTRTIAPKSRRSQSATEQKDGHVYGPTFIKRHPE